MIKEYCIECERCIYMKLTNIPLAGKLNPNSILKESWQDISVNFITDLPQSSGFNAILVVVDQFFKEVIFISTTKTIILLRTVKLYQDYVWKTHGLSWSLILD